MSRTSRIALGGCASVVMIALALWLFNFRSFTGGKAVLARLQGLEAIHRHEKLLAPQVFATFDDTGPVLVVATIDRAFPYAWIAAAISSCDGTLCMVGGDARLYIRCSDIAGLEARIKIAQPVDAKLRESCLAK